MVPWMNALDKIAIRKGVLRLSDRFLTCPKCHRKRDMQEWFYIRTNAECWECVREMSWNRPRTRWGAIVYDESKTDRTVH